MRDKLDARFGASLQIVENFHAARGRAKGASNTLSNVVAMVMGPMPYVLQLRDGTKLAANRGGEALKTSMESFEPLRIRAGLSPGASRAGGAIREGDGSRMCS